MIAACRRGDHGCELPGPDGRPTPFTRRHVATYGYVWPSAMADFTKWSDLDGCTRCPVPIAMHSLCQSRSNCAGGAEVVLCSPNAGQVFTARPARELLPFRMSLGGLAAPLAALIVWRIARRAFLLQTIYALRIEDQIVVVRVDQLEGPSCGSRIRRRKTRR